MKSLIISLTVLCASPVLGEPLRIVTDIAPVQSIVSMVAGDLAETGVLLGAGASAHHANLSPSQGRAISDADLIVRIGPALNPTLERQAANLAPGARHLVLQDVPGIHILPSRAVALFKDHDDEDTHDHDHDHAHDQDIQQPDPHLWLSPDNAQVWVAHVAGILADLDPENAATYQSNAKAAIASISASEIQITELLAPVSQMTFFVMHDAFQYLEDRFDLKIVGAISASDAAKPGPKRLQSVRDAVSVTSKPCLLVEKGAQLQYVQSVAGAQNIKPIVVDLLGSEDPAGPKQYTNLLVNLAQDIASCAVTDP